MRFDLRLLILTLFGLTAVRAFAVPGSDAAQELWKRKGGGGGGGRGGGGGSSGSGSKGGGSSGGRSGGGSSTGGGRTGGSSGSRGGGSSSSGTGGRTSGRGSSSSNSGGSTTTGSGVSRGFGGGRYYGGGATTPYRSGSSRGGVTPFLLGGAAVGGLAALAFWPGTWHHPAYFYPYQHPYTYHNATTDKDETKNVTCACDSTVECGCDPTTNATLKEMIGNGSYQALNKSQITVSENGTMLLVNGTLANGTTAPGGDEDPNAGTGMRVALQAAGWWPVLATVVSMVFFT